MCDGWETTSTRESLSVEYKFAITAVDFKERTNNWKCYTCLCQWAKTMDFLEFTKWKIGTKKDKNDYPWEGNAGIAGEYLWMS